MATRYWLRTWEAQISVWKTNTLSKSNNHVEQKPEENKTRSFQSLPISSTSNLNGHWASPTFPPLKVQELFQQVAPTSPELNTDWTPPKAPRTLGIETNMIECDSFVEPLDLNKASCDSLGVMSRVCEFVCFEDHFWWTPTSANVIHLAMLIASRCVYSTLGARAFATNWHRSACLPAKAWCHGHQPKHVPNHKSASIPANSCQTPNNEILMNIEYCNKSRQFLPLIKAQMIALPETPQGLRVKSCVPCDYYTALGRERHASSDQTLVADKKVAPHLVESRHFWHTNAQYA